MDTGNSLLFVDYDDEGRLFINPAAADFLTTIREPIAIIGVMGISGEGKSFTLNQFLHRNDGFKVASTITPCTKGMWLWNTLLTHDSGHKLLLLDCEGFDEHTKRGRERRHLVYLSLLLCSIIIHNQYGGHIRPQTLGRLSLLTRVTDEISVRETQQEAETYQQEPSSDFGSVFPTLIWLINNYVEGRIHPRTPDQHLHEVLMDVDGCHFNQIKKTIKELFPIMHCYTLPRPSDCGSCLQQLDRVSFDAMRQPYKEKRDKFVKFVLGKTDVKKVDDMVLTGPMLVGITCQFIDAFNKDEVPTVTLIWKNVQDHINHLTQVVARGLVIYIDIFNTLLGEISQQCDPRSNDFTTEDDAHARGARVSFQAGLPKAHDDACVVALMYLDTMDLGSSRLECERWLKECMHAEYEARSEWSVAEQWLVGKSQLQDSMLKYADPILWSTDINRKAEDLESAGVVKEKGRPSCVEEESKNDGAKVVKRAVGRPSKNRGRRPANVK